MLTFLNNQVKPPIGPIDSERRCVVGCEWLQADASGRPQMMRLIVPDKVTALTSAQAITAAVVQRYRTGKGTRIDLSMLDAVIAFAWGEAFAQLGFVGGQDPNFEYTRYVRIM